RLSEWDRTRPVACLCHHGSRSMQVAAFLVQQGFEHVANIAGGIHAWSSQVDASVPTY
ncbi:MAG: rhodanese-like domain-containing protein, partial [Burkholderiaceae bacterium]